MLSAKSLLRGLTVACALLSAPALVASQLTKITPIATAESRSYAVDAAAVRSPTSQSFSYAGSSFISVHFSSFLLLDGDKVVVRSVDGSTRFEYTGLGRGKLGLQGGFYSSRVPGDTAVVEFVPAQGSAIQTTGISQGFAIDQITRASKSVSPFTVCGTDDSQPAKCYANDTTAIYATSSAVVRLFINGTTPCTGWLVGSEGHVLTNHHCLDKPELPLVTDYELRAESSSCDNECRVRMGCPGTIVASSAELVATDADLDYTLVKLKTTADLSSYGYMKLRVAGPKLNERIYIPQHPSGYAKRIAVVTDDGSFAKVEGVDASSACGDHRVLYTADTIGGSSGSPVVAAEDNAVVALHSCGVVNLPCVNSGTDIRGIISDWKNKGVVPKDALDDPNAAVPVGGWTPGVTQAPTPAPTKPPFSICSIYIYQNTCQASTLGSCQWLNGKCVAK